MSLGKFFAFNIVFNFCQIKKIPQPNLTDWGSGRKLYKSNPYWLLLYQ